jgi:hypothetical protein
VIAEKALIQAALRRLFQHVLRLGDLTEAAMAVDAKPVSEGLSIGVCYAGPDLQASKRRFLDGGAFRGDEGYGLLGLRRLVRSRGGRIATKGAAGTGRVRIELTLPGCLLKSGDATATRQSLP